MSLFIHLLACASPDKLLGDSNVFVDDTTTDTQLDSSVVESANPETGSAINNLDSVNGLLSGEVEDGDIISLTNLIVTSPSNDDGFFASDVEGGENSGIWVQADFDEKGIFAVEVGQSISLEGVYTEPTDDSVYHNGLDDSQSTVLVSDSQDIVVAPVPLMDPVATVVITDDLAVAEIAENYEGVLVKIMAPVMTVVGDAILLNDAVPLGDRFLPLNPSEMAAVTNLSYIYGILAYDNGQYKLSPRTNADALSAPNTPDMIDDSELYFSEIFFTNQPPSNCSPDLHWYAEITYAANNTENLDLSGLYLLQFDGSTLSAISSVSSATTEFTHGETMIISSGNSSCLSLPSSPATSVPQLANELVSLYNPVSALNTDDILKLVSAESVDAIASGTYTLIDMVNLNSFGTPGTSFELRSNYTGANTDDVNLDADSDGFWDHWCTSGESLQNTSGDVLFGSSYPSTFFGSPGELDKHCFWDDADGDTFTAAAGDCDDSDANTFPGSAENDSSTVCMTDVDGDGYGSDTPIQGVTAGTDCDDALDVIHPAATEIQNGHDDNCNGLVDEQ